VGESNSTMDPRCSDPVQPGSGVMPSGAD